MIFQNSTADLLIYISGDLLTPLIMCQTNFEAIISMRVGEVGFRAQAHLLLQILANITFTTF